jgi:hypothetical protein
MRWLTFAPPSPSPNIPEPLHSNHGTRTPARRLPIPETLSVLVAPEEMLARALNSNPHLQQFRIVFITGIRSGALSQLDRRSMDLIVRRAFTSVQLRTILEENHHPFLVVEHTPQLYERARDMASRLAEAMKQASREATIVLYAPTLDRQLESMAEFANRVFCFYDTQGSGRRLLRNTSIELASQTTLEAFS